MRPIRLKLKGLRSYRAEREIDFTGIGLMAIVGDTGSGKSSLLEGIVYALFNGTTWDGKAVRELISMGEQTMTVEFDFEVDGKVWQVRRATSKTAAESVHSLSCLSERIDAIDKEGPVNARIKELLGGMDRERFLSAVLLPQGQFQSLLQASRADRARILKGIFRLERLDEIRTLADRHHLEYRPRLDLQISQRAELPGDPVVAAEEAEQGRQEAEARHQLLDDLRKRLRLTEDACRKAGEQAASMGVHAQRIRDADTKVAAALETLLPLQEDVDRRRSGLGLEHEAARLLAEARAGELVAAEGGGEGRDQMLAAKVAVEHIQRELPELTKERSQLDRINESLQANRKELDRRRPEVEGQESEASLAAMDRDTAEGNARTLSEELQEARKRLQAWLAQATSAREAAERLPGFDRAIEAAGVSVTTAGSAVVGAQSLLRALTERLDGLRRQNAALHAAHGVAPGQPCPVCSQTLPEGFVPPHVSDETSTLKELEMATEAARAADQDLATSQLRFHQAGEARLKAETIATVAIEVSAHRETELLEVLPANEANYDHPTRLDHLAEREGLAATAVLDLRVKAEQAMKVAVAIRSDWDARNRALDTAERAQIEQLRRLDEREERIRAMWVQVPVSILQEDSRAPVLPVPDLTTVAAVLKTLETVLIRLNELAEQRDLASVQMRGLEGQLGELNEEERRTITVPRQVRRVELAGLRQRLLDASVAVESTPPADNPGAECVLAEDLSWARALESMAVTVLAALDSHREIAAEVVAEQQETALVIMAEAGVESADALEEAVITSATQAELAKAAHRQVLGQIPRAVELDHRIKEGTGLVCALGDLAKLLTEGQFIGYAVSQRERALLGIASDLLGSMTAQRYGFADNFQVVDRQSGQARGTKTLSGGETFLASLALALGLVELAGRSGGRMQALFLDEGFGSLDANALDEALGELERCAGSGRLVAVVSHIRAVAERLETVLSVTRTPTGSEIRWLKASDRDHLVEEEVEQGLLA